MQAPLRRGTNISHWLSQSGQRGAERRAKFTRDDVNRIAEFGFDHFRLPIDESQMWTGDGERENEAWDLLDGALDWAEDANLAVVVDLHILRSHFFGQSAEPALFTDPAEAEKFADKWRQLSARLRSRPNDRVLYELMNEPVATQSADWNRVAHTAFRTIRQTEPDRWIVLGSNRWSSVFTFGELAVPADTRTLLTFHFYLPMLVTHHRAGWCAEGRTYAGPIQYPGSPIPPDHLPEAVLPPAERLIQLHLEELNRPYDWQQMQAALAQPLAVAAQHALPLYCGEFGVINRAPLPIRLAWSRDLVSVFEANGIAWANWDYRGDFGILAPDGQSLGLAETMLSAGR